MDVTQERELIRICQKDPSAFGPLYDAHFDSIFRYALYRVANVPEAEDITAQVFFKAIKNLWRYRLTRAPFSAWLFRLASNETADHLRRKMKVEDGLGESWDERLPAPDLSPEAELEQARSQMEQNRGFLALHQCLKHLKTEDQNLLILRYFEEKSYKDIAALMSTREATLRMRCLRATTRLKKLMEAKGYSASLLDESLHRRNVASLSQTP